MRDGRGGEQHARGFRETCKGRSAEEHLSGTFGTNIFGTIFIVQAALPHPEQGASLVNMAP